MFILSLLVIWGLNLNSPQNDVIDNYLKEYLSQYKKYSYEIASMPNNYGRNYKIKIDRNRKTKIKSGYIYIPVHIQPGNGKSTQSIITLKIKLYADVLVSSQMIRRGTELDKNQYKITEKEVAHLRFEPIKSFRELEGKRAKTTIREGIILSENLIEKIPEILQGEPVIAYYKRGGVEISFEATAKKDGYINEVIRIQTKKRRVYKAKVEEKGKVKIIDLK